MGSKCNLFCLFVSATTTALFTVIFILIMALGKCPSLNALPVPIILCLTCGGIVGNMIYRFPIFAELLNSLGKKSFEFRKTYELTSGF